MALVQKQNTGKSRLSRDDQNEVGFETVKQTRLSPFDYLHVNTDIHSFVGIC